MSAKPAREHSPERSAPNSWRTLMSTGLSLVTLRGEIFSVRLTRSLEPRSHRHRKLDYIPLFASENTSSKERMEPPMMCWEHSSMDSRARSRTGLRLSLLTSQSGPLELVKLLPQKWLKKPMLSSDHGCLKTAEKRLRQPWEFNMVDPWTPRMQML